MLSDYINKHKELVLSYVLQQCEDLKSLNISNASKIADRLYEYTSRGKCLRGVLVCLSAESFGMTINSEVLNTAASIELAQTALLIHDDIMDQDDFRRNKPSIHKLYQNEGFSPHISMSLAMCLGDVSLFHLFRYLPNQQVVLLFTEELTKTALAQALEVEKAQIDISYEEIISILENKTANYTFYLPIQSGIILANQQINSQIVKDLSNLLGLIFQIRDDELNYLTESQIGKSSGGDIRENKNTLCRYFLLQHAPEVQNLFGKEDHVEQIKQLYHSSGTYQFVQEKLVVYTKEAELYIDKLPIEKKYKQLWDELLQYVQNRSY